MTKHIYVAAPLFSDAERQFNCALKAKLSSVAPVFLPQEDGELLHDLVRQGATHEDAARRVFAHDTRAITDAGLVVAVLDGRSIDEGVAFELGYAFALGVHCVALHTDWRRLLPTGNNPMIDCALEATFSSIDALVEYARQVVRQSVK